MNDSENIFLKNAKQVTPKILPWATASFVCANLMLGGLLLAQAYMPFALLLSAGLKRRANRLVLVAGLVIVMRAVDTVWLIAPEFHGGAGFSGKLAVVGDVLVLIGLGGIWVWFFLTQLKSRPLLPLHDPSWSEEAEAVEAHT